MIGQAARSRAAAQSTVLLVLGAEAALFATLVMSYLYLRTGGSNTPFTRVGSADVVIASLNTVILLASAVFVARAARAIAAGRVEGLKTDLAITLVLGSVFIIGQAVEFNHSGMRIDDLAYGGASFALISFHALHLIAGMTVLALNLARAQAGDFSAQRHVAITVGAWFWYFVVAVWVVLFCVLFIV